VARGLEKHYVLRGAGAAVRIRAQMTRPLVDLSVYDLSRTVLDKAGILASLPQRHEFEQIDSICVMDVPNQVIVGRRRVRHDEWWIRGHVPSMPLFPGVMLIEASGQICAILYKRVIPELADRFIAFAGVDEARFRGTIRPGDEVLLVGKGLVANRRLSRCAVQALVDGRVVFECSVIGMPLPDGR
jgi:3-hydroxyacyl-[acyl-carrier-protein] dehydratase